MSETTPGGSNVFRHQPRERELEFSAGDPELVEAVSDHLETCFGAEPTVFHEVISDLVHVDVHAVPAGGERTWTTLVTTGLAERPMTVPEGLEEHRFAELVLALPEGWPLDQASLEDERNYWPIKLLKMLARVPHEFETFLGIGHTIPNGNPPEPYVSNSELCCACILPAVLVPDGFHSLELKDGRRLSFYAVVPLHEDEMNFKLRKGNDALMDRLDEAGVTELLDSNRPSVAPRRRGLFGR